jgi:outer membrane protein assembly factor BamB
MKNVMLLVGTFINILFAYLSFGQSEVFQLAQDTVLVKPKLFSNLGDSLSTPDGLAIDKNGKLYLSVPNGNDYEKFGSAIYTFDSKNKPVKWFDKLPIHPITNRVHPMGMEFGPDGNLYINDNQCFAGKLNQSRLIRIVIENNKPLRAEILVEGMNFANGLRWNKNKLYISESILPGEKQSGIYHFSLTELNQQLIQIDTLERDSHILCSFQTKEEADPNSIGIDGICFDGNGNLYAGNFGDGVISKITFNSDETIKSQNVIIDNEAIKCCDGMYYDKQKNFIYLANYMNNCVHYLNLNTNTIHLLWENENNNGLNGFLDHPCEPILFQGKLIVVNFDSYIGGKNTEVDAYHTISVFELGE